MNKILFLDIETVPLAEKLVQIPENLQHCWEEKFSALSRRMPEKYNNQTAAESFETNAGIYSEFGKIVCISMGMIYHNGDKQHLRITSLASESEREILLSFKQIVENKVRTPIHNFCGHNIKEFDIPYICRRMLINGIELPNILKISGKKPWEIPFIDTLEMWKFGDMKNFTSLKLLTAILGIATPKDDIDGSQVASIFYGERNIERIKIYCQKDVVATVQVFLKLSGKAMIEEENVEFV